MDVKSNLLIIFGIIVIALATIGYYAYTMQALDTETVKIIIGTLGGMAAGAGIAIGSTSNKSE